MTLRAQAHARKTMLAPSTSLLPLPTGKYFALFSRHDAPRMDNTQQYESQQHRQTVQTILICFVVWDSAVKTIRILAKAEDNS
jgi:hypothetical protein